jgi:hypothetical protein
MGSFNISLCDQSKVQRSLKSRTETENLENCPFFIEANFLSSADLPNSKGLLSPCQRKVRHRLRNQCSSIFSLVVKSFKDEERLSVHC